MDHSKRQSDCSFAGDKPSGNGDVKLFGAVLISSQQRTNNSIEITDDNSSQAHETGRGSLNLKLNTDQKVNFDSTPSKFDCNNYIGAEKIPVKSFGFCDGNRMQSRIPPLPDSTLLLTKYPDAFSHYVPCGTGKISDCSMNNLFVSASRELSSSKELADDQGSRNRGLQPFAIDMKQPQDIMFTEIQRRNGFDLGSGMQQQARVMSGINVVGRGGVFIGGQHSSVTDLGASTKMHIAKAEQLGIERGNIGKVDDRMISNRDVGR